MTTYNYAIVTNVRKGTSQKTGQAFHVIEVLVSPSKGKFGTLTYFLKPSQIPMTQWNSVRQGSIVEVALEERDRGLSTYSVIEDMRLAQSEVTAQLTFSPAKPL